MTAAASEVTENPDEDEIGRNREDQPQYKTAYQKSSDQVSSGTCHLFENDSGAVLLVNRVHDGVKDLACTGQSKDARAYFIAVEVKEIPIQRITDPRSQDGCEFAAFEEERKKKGKSSLKRQDRHRTCKDAQGHPQGQLARMSSQANESEAEVLEGPPVFVALPSVSSEVT